jgi:pimeloyl-ACP methyl ester carboxylesterase
MRRTKLEGGQPVIDPRAKVAPKAEHGDTTDTPGNANAVQPWKTRKSFRTTTGDDVAYTVFGGGPPLVLVHGTPSSSYLWRNVALRLAEHFTVHLYDLAGYGASTQRDGQDVSLAAQTRIATELLDHWGLDEPGIAGHDFGAAVTLRLMLLDGRRFRRVGLLDAVAIAPWITPFSRHVHRHMDAFATLPEHIHREMIATHIRTAIHRPMSDKDLVPYLRPWLGPRGQAAYYRQVAQFDEAYTREIEPRYGEIDTPTLVLWGANDGWLDPRFGRQLADTIPGARLSLIPNAGHFVQEDQPAAVAAELDAFFREA